MARRSSDKKTRRNGLGAALTPRGRAVMRALHEARHHAPGFIVSCGVLPEVSESASDQMHAIVRNVADRWLDTRRHLREVHRAVPRRPGSADADLFESHLNAVLGAEATAAYLFGLAVGLSIHGLPERLLRGPR